MKTQKLTFDQLHQDLEVLDNKDLNSIKAGMSAGELLAGIAANGLDRYVGSYQFGDGGDNNFTNFSFANSTLQAISAAAGDGGGGFSYVSQAYADKNWHNIKLDKQGISLNEVSINGNKNNNLFDKVASGIGINTGVKEGLFELAKETGELGKAGERYLSFTKALGKATGVIGAGIAWSDYYENQTTGGLIKALTNTGLVFVRTNPFIGVGLGILDLSGGSDWVYNKIGDGVNNVIE